MTIFSSVIFVFMLLLVIIGYSKLLHFAICSTISFRQLNSKYLNMTVFYSTFMIISLMNVIIRYSIYQYLFLVLS